MLEVFAQILMALLMVYGFYCIIISVTYMIFRGEKENLVIAIMDKGEKCIDFQLILAKRIFPFKVPIVIVVDEDTDDERIKELKRKYSHLDIYRTEKIKNEKRSGNDN